MVRTNLFRSFRRMGAGRFMPRVAKRRSVVSASLWWLGMMLIPAAGYSHQPFAAYIHHQAELRVTPRTVDIELELTFHNALALSERTILDADGDGQISRAETVQYLETRADEFARPLLVFIDRRPVSVIPLYEPRLDLLADTRAAPTPLILRLYFFSRVPEHLGSAWTVEVDDRLFPHEPAVCVWNCTAADGIQLADEPRTAMLLSADSGATPRRVELRIVSTTLPSSSTGPVLSMGNSAATSHLMKTILAVPWIPAVGIGPVMAVLPVYLYWNEILTNPWGGE